MRSAVLWNGLLDSHQPTEIIEVMVKITGAKAASVIGLDPGTTIGFDTPGSATAALGQTTIDNLLGSTNEFIAATAFGATAMGTDVIGFVFDLKGQAKFTDECYLEVVGNIANVVPAAAVSLGVQGQITALPDTLAAPARMEISAAGNVAGQVVITGLDAATSGLLVFRLCLKLK